MFINRQCCTLNFEEGNLFEPKIKKKELRMSDKFLETK